MSKTNQILIILTLIVMTGIMIAAWSTFVLLSHIYMYVLFSVLVILSIGGTIILWLRGYDYEYHRSYDRRDRAEVSRQEQEKTTSIILDNQARHLELDHYGEVISRNLETQGVYVKKMLGTTFDKIKGTEPLALPEGLVEDRGIPTYVPFSQYVDPSTCTLDNFFIGVTYENQPLWLNFKKMIHVLIVGATGGGKSIFLTNLLTQIIYSQEDVRLDLVDLGSGTFEHFDLPFARDIRQAEDIIRKWRDEIERRRSLYTSLKEKGKPAIQTLDAYNRHPKVDELLPYSVLFVEEGLNMLRESNRIEGDLRYIVANARKYGLMVVFTTQSAKSKVLDTEIRDNFQTRVGFRTREKSLGRVIFPDFNFKTLGDTDGRSYIDVLNASSWIVQTPLVEDQTMADAGLIAERKDIARPLSDEPLRIIDAEPEIIDLSQFTKFDEDGLPLIPKAYGTAKERIKAFYRICKDKGINTENIEDARVLKNSEASLAGYHYNVLRQVKPS